MLRLLEFIRSIYVVILFIIAETIAISHYANSNSYTRAKIFVVSNSVVGGVNGTLRNTGHLFQLSSENRRLSERIASLESQLDQYEQSAQAHYELPAEEILFDNPAYTYIVGKVVSSSINKRNNYIVVDKGIEDGVYERMAVITPSGEMLGYVAGCTGRYSAVLSVLSHDFTTSGKVKGGTAYGSVNWPGTDRYSVSMSELSKYETVNIGDTILTTGFSNIFPGDVRIGTVASFGFNEMETAYHVEIDLAAEITSVGYVLLVGSRESGEIEELLDSVTADY